MPREVWTQGSFEKGDLPSRIPKIGWPPGRGLRVIVIALAARSFGLEVLGA